MRSFINVWTLNFVDIFFIAKLINIKPQFRCIIYWCNNSCTTWSCLHTSRIKSMYIGHTYQVEKNTLKWSISISSD